ncbi:DUF4376 domain-containing protein [Marivibrio halodurans]|uniref:DUF4376 domain-containing protein n=1 Tax=Marivibrio halodurans TaxID=2039722 RepID=A0A8J7S8F6_9PROT|nr:DUF4376 domain-containing protein [Marivibrio halodurans]MBP5857302.1 DUF4376 domain-containing protein [Marivibrio halodurans]
MTTKTVYQTDADGYLLAPLVLDASDRDPMEPARWLLPAGAVEEAPPEPQSGAIARWTGSAWEQIEDHRGETVYDQETGAASTILAPGPLPAGVAATPPEPTLQERCDAVDALRDSKIAGGFTFGGTAFQTDPNSVKRIAGTASAAHIAITLDGAEAGDLRWADPDSDFVWIATDNSLVEMDAPTAIAFGKAYLAFERRLVFAASAIKARLRDGEDFDIETAAEWP